MSELTAHASNEVDVVVNLDNVQRVFIQGICGSAMAGIALILKEMGLDVSGSDASPGPPMQTLLDWKEIPCHVGFCPENLDPEPDLVITGNVISENNPEAVAIRNRGIPFISFPEFLEQTVLKDRRGVVMAGTHGKTTCTSLAAWLLEAAGENPGFLSGGIHRNFMVNARLGSGDWFVIEGDEYETSFFAKHPKFFHYPGNGILLTSMEYDHADLYTEDVYNRLFYDFLSKQSVETVLGVYEDIRFLDSIKEAFPGKLFTYGTSEHSDWRLLAWQPDWQLVTLELGPNRHTFKTPMAGMHNALNLTGVFGLLTEMEIDTTPLIEGVREYAGVKRRQEILYTSPMVSVVDDFAHHPTAVALTIEAFRELYPGRRIVAVFEPRTRTSRTRIFQDSYVQSLAWADCANILGAEEMKDPRDADCLDAGEVVRQLHMHGLEADLFVSPDSLYKHLAHDTKEPTVILCMSSGSMNGLPDRLAEYFRNRAGSPSRA